MMFLPEHHFTERSAIPEPLLLLAGVAASTTKLRLGTTSYLLPLRNPILAAEHVAVLDQLSNGRVTLGVGRGYAAEMFEVFDVDPKKKRAVFKRNLEMMIRLWRGEVIESEEQSHPIRVSPLPVQKPHPEIWVAAFGPLALQQAGSFGFPYLASPMETMDRLNKNYKHHKSSCVDLGVAVPDKTPIMRTVFCSENSKEVASLRERVAASLNQVVRSEANDQSSVKLDDWAIIGDAKFVKDQMAEYVERLGVTDVVATRLRISGIESQALERSFARTAEIILS